MCGEFEDFILYKDKFRKQSIIKAGTKINAKNMVKTQKAKSPYKNHKKNTGFSY